MSNIQIFNNPEFGSIRSVRKNGEPWFVGKDVAEILGYESPRSAVSKKVDAEDRGVSKMATPSGIQEMTLINESGLYSLILSSKLPMAKMLRQNGIEIGQNRLFRILRERGYLMKGGADKNMPTQRSMESGWFRIKARTITTPDGSNRSTRTVLVTGKGQQYFVDLFLKEEPGLW